MAIEKILVIDDERAIRQALEGWLRDKRYGVSSADSIASGDRLLRGDSFDLVFLDLKLPDGNGIELLERIQKMPERPHVVMMTGEATLDSVIAAMRLGAFDYLVKPFGKDNIELIIRRAEAFTQVVRVNQILSADLTDTRDLIGSSAAFENLREMIRKVAPTEATVLIEGENGTGKELVARAIYRASGRAQAPYIKVNCAAVPENLIESEFFGHEKGSFTGATERREGRFELADGGTLLLDEVSEIPPHLQAKLLRVLQEREFERVGGTKTIKVDVRVLATTNRELRKAVEAGEFREDLYYRLNVFPVHVPALRDRPADIPVLAEHFLKRFARRHGRDIAGFTAAASAALLQHRWPGNVREFQNTIERAVILTESGHPIEQSSLGVPPAMAQPRPAAPLSAQQPQELPASKTGPVLSLYEVEKEHILHALQATGGNRAKAADALQISIRTLRNKLNEYRIGVSAEN
jgi:DNA-binding NtrC family response regulator